MKITEEWVAVFKRQIKLKGSKIKSVLKIRIMDVDPHASSATGMLEAAIFYKNLETPQGFTKAGIHRRAKEIESESQY